MIHPLAGRPDAHLLARLRKHCAPNLRAIATPKEWLLARSVDSAFVVQRVARGIRISSLRKQLLQSPSIMFTCFTPSIFLPIPKPYLISFAGVVYPQTEKTDIRKDTADALLALKGLPATYAFGDASGLWLLDSDTGTDHAVGRPPSGEVRWGNGPPFVTATVSKDATYLHRALPDGTIQIPSLDDLQSAHVRLSLGLSQEILLALWRIFPMTRTGVRIRRAPNTLLISRVTRSGRAYPALLAAVP